MNRISDRIRKESKALRIQAEKIDCHIFLLLLAFFIISNIVFEIGWEQKTIANVWKVHFALFTVVMWGSAVYLFYILAEWRMAWKRTGILILIGICVFSVTSLVSKYITTDSYKFIIGAFFCLAVCGKNYHNTLKCYLLIISVTLLLGLILMRFGIAFDAAKPDRLYGGHSLGIVYPNNWGYLFFALMALVWYMFLYRKRVVTLLLFEATTVFMYKYITCQTIAILSFLFPFSAILSEMLEDKAQKSDTAVPTKWNRIVEVFFIILPFLFLAFMLFFCWQMDWVHDTFYGTKLHTFAMRFVEGGYALKLAPLKLFGRPFEQMQTGVIDYLNEIDMKIDSAYLTYIIIRGIIPMGMTLGWISLAHKRCLRMRDYRLLCISVFMLIFSMMERPGLDVWYNFVLLYPLAGLQDDTADHFGMAITASV